MECSLSCHDPVLVTLLNKLVFTESKEVRTHEQLKVVMLETAKQSKVVGAALQSLISTTNDRQTLLREFKHLLQTNYDARQQRNKSVLQRRDDQGLIIVDQKAKEARTRKKIEEIEVLSNRIKKINLILENNLAEQDCANKIANEAETNVREALGLAKQNQGGHGVDSDDDDVEFGDMGADLNISAVKFQELKENGQDEKYLNYTSSIRKCHLLKKYEEAYKQKMRTLKTRMATKEQELQVMENTSTLYKSKVIERCITDKTFPPQGGFSFTSENRRAVQQASLLRTLGTMGMATHLQISNDGMLLGDIHKYTKLRLFVAKVGNGWLKLAKQVMPPMIPVTYDLLVILMRNILDLKNRDDTRDLYPEVMGKVYPKRSQENGNVTKQIKELKDQVEKLIKMVLKKNKSGKDQQGNRDKKTLGGSQARNQKVHTDGNSVSNKTSSRSGRSVSWDDLNTQDQQLFNWIPKNVVPQMLKFCGKDGKYVRITFLEQVPILDNKGNAHIVWKMAKFEHAKILTAYQENKITLQKMLAKFHTWKEFILNNMNNISDTTEKDEYGAPDKKSRRLVLNPLSTADKEDKIKKAEADAVDSSSSNKTKGGSYFAGKVDLETETWDYDDNINFDETNISGL